MSFRFLDGWATDLVYSPNDNGFYIEVINEKGETIFSTKVHKQSQDAVNEAGKWTEKHEAPKYRGLE